ncbi:hypothetical protein [Haliangium sp.]|uniref:hypothetical protein n=1 Tax=Haliangium sp. TaxID=2663208 RepID=UPI003D15221D
MLLGSALILAAPAAAQPQELPEPDDDSSIVDEIDKAVADTAELPWARDIPIATRKRAYRFFLAGNELLKQALFRLGADKYREALQRWEHPAFYFNLGVAQMNLDQIIDAYHSFQSSRVHGPRPVGQEKYEQAEYYLKVLGNQLATIEVTCDEPGAKVAIDGVPAFVAPGAERRLVRPGRHRIEANKEGRDADIQQVVLGPGEQQLVTLAPPFPAYVTAERYWATWMPVAVTSAGLLIVGGSAYMQTRSTVLFEDYDRDINARCTGPTGCRAEQVPEAVHARLDRAMSLRQGARIGYIAGGTIIAASFVLYVLNRERIVVRRHTSETAPLSIVPILTATELGAAAALRF